MSERGDTGFILLATKNITEKIGSHCAGDSDTSF